VSLAQLLQAGKIRHILPEELAQLVKFSVKHALSEQASQDEAKQVRKLVRITKGMLAPSEILDTAAQIPDNSPFKEWETLKAELLASVMIVEEMGGENAKADDGGSLGADAIVGNEPE
jgi:hypothetical protein